LQGKYEIKESAFEVKKIHEIVLALYSSRSV